MKIFSYAGVGFRETPPEIQAHMTMAATQLSSYGLILRSGGAEGAFERGADPMLKEIFLPWKGFNGHPSPLYWIPDEAHDLAEQCHPGWKTMRLSVRRLMAHNIQQILGRTLQDPVLFVICWTPGGSGSGGTGQAIRCARNFDIPVFDMGAMPLEEIAENINQILTKEGIIP